MPAPQSALMAGAVDAPAPRPVSLADLLAPPLTNQLVVPPTQLLIDCEGRLLPHPLGVCRFVAQLLQLRRRGASLWLTNVHPELDRCLHQLGLEAVLHLTGEARPTAAAPRAWQQAARL